jgi:ABC-type transport system involved in cytochrome bd biosynthesis fused ATPase/permease subunit
MSTVTESDQVVYLENGELVAVGTLEEVAKIVPTFAKNLENLISD